MKSVRFGLAVMTLTAFAALGDARAQEKSDYFPYAPGDSAVFEQVPGVTHAIWVHQELEIGAHTYTIVNGIEGRRSPDTLRVDGEQVYRFDKGSEYVLYDFGLPDSTFYRVQESPFEDYRVLVTRGHSARVPAGSFDDIVHLYFDIPGPVDDEWLYAFAPGVGLVWHGGAWGGGALIWARIGGVIVTPIEEPNPAPERLELYPNPATTTIVVKRAGAYADGTNLTILDMLGRRVGPSLVLDAATTTLIDVSGLAPGVYLARLRTGKSLYTRPVVIVR